MHRREFTDDGGWCWFQDPRAIRHTNEHDRTYVGWITRRGKIQVGQYDHDTGSLTVTTLDPAFQRDDHNDPTFAIRPDHRLLVFYTEHGGKDVRYRISTDPESIEHFEAERRIEPDGDHSITYPNPRWIDGELHLLVRNNGVVTDFISRDGGDTWDEPRELISTDGNGWCVYSKVSRPTDGEVHFGLTHAMGGVNEPHLHVYHAKYDGESIMTSDGSVVGNAEADELPVSIYDTTPVFDSTASGDDAWIWDCAVTGGVPQVTYAQLVDDDDHRYRYARWEDGDWKDILLCHGGKYIISGEENAERYYSGGVVLDHDVEGVCYASIGSHDSSCIVRFERLTSGWEQRTVQPADVQNVRPVVPWNRQSDLDVCWLRGSYTHFAPHFSPDEYAGYETSVVGTDSFG